jgi:hypothetical protein
MTLVLDALLAEGKKQLRFAQSAHQQGGGAATSRAMLERELAALCTIIELTYQTCSPAQLTRAVRLMADMYVNLNFDYNVLLPRAALREQAGDFRDRVNTVLTLGLDIDPMALGTFNYALAETNHVLQEHKLAVSYARHVLAVPDHPLRQFAQRLVIINRYDTTDSQLREEIAVGREMLKTIGEDSQLREGIAQGLIRLGDASCFDELATVRRAAFSTHSAIILSMWHRTLMLANNKFYPGDHAKQFQEANSFIIFVKSCGLEKYYEQAVEIGRAGGIELWLDTQATVQYQILT